MPDSTLVILSAMLTVAIIVALGAFARKMNWLTQQADTSLLSLTICVLLPCLILDVIVGNPKLQQASNVFLPPTVGFLLAAAGMFVAWGLAKLVGPYVGLKTPAAQRTFAFSAGIVNYGFIPIPLTDVLWRHEPEIRNATMGVLLIHNTGVDLAIWTVGIIVLTGSVGSGWIKRVLNPVSITIVAALLINMVNQATGWDEQIPTSLASGMRNAIHMAGLASVPLSLILVGATIFDYFPSLSPRKALGTIGLGALLRLGLLPCLFIAVAWCLPFSAELKRVLVIQAAMPSAMIPIVLARHYEGDPATALRVALGTTLISLITIPLWLHFGLGWVGLGL